MTIPSAVDAPHFAAFGFVVLRRAFDPGPLGDEIDEALRDGLSSGSAARVGAGEVRFRYVPMMTARTPASLSLLDRLAPVASALLGRPVLPTRAKGVRYFGDTAWHSDSVLPIASVGFAAYLEPLEADTGALRVLPASHRAEIGDGVRALGGVGMHATALPGHVVATEPGDVIAFDEHLFHASVGGGRRRQWRADYVADPVGRDAEEHAKAYFAGIFPADWDGGYDVDRYPSYGADWRASGRAAARRLEELGVYTLAEQQEARMRARR